MIGAGFWGGLPIRATVTCCNEPIAGNADTWGRIKGIYR